MKQRILVAVVGIPALLAVLCIAPAWATALLLAALTVIAAHELLTAVCGPDKARRWTVLPAVCGLPFTNNTVMVLPPDLVLIHILYNKKPKNATGSFAIKPSPVDNTA